MKKTNSIFVICTDALNYVLLSERISTGRSSSHKAMYKAYISALFVVLSTSNTTSMTPPIPHQGSSPPSRSICTTAQPQAACLWTLLSLKKTLIAILPLQLLGFGSQCSEHFDRQQTDDDSIAQDRPFSPSHSLQRRKRLHPPAANNRCLCVCNLLISTNLIRHQQPQQWYNLRLSVPGPSQSLHTFQCTQPYLQATSCVNAPLITQCLALSPQESSD